MVSARKSDSEGRASARPRARRITPKKRTRGSASLRPFLAATFAMTADGKITTREYSPVGFTSPEDKMHLLRQRALADAVLIGHSTLKQDNVRLGLPKGDLREERIARGQTASPLRVIVSNQGRIDSSLKIFQSQIAPILIFSTTRMPRNTQKALREKATLHLSEARA